MEHIKMSTTERFAFFGSPRFAATILASLAKAGYIPSLVIVSPDRPTGRKKTLTPPPVKQMLAGNAAFAGKEIKLVQPEKLSPAQFSIAGQSCSFAIVAAYAKIIPKNLLDSFPRGVAGVHPSLLPKYRGASPIQSAILAGEQTTGVTIYFVDEKMDHGPILAQQTLNENLQTMDYERAHDALAELGGKLLADTLPFWLDGTLVPKPQDHDRATFTKKFTADDAFIDPEKLLAAVSGENVTAAAEVDRTIRALNPEPGVWTYANSALRLPADKEGMRTCELGIKDGKRIKLLGAKLEHGKLVLTKIQVEGKTPRDIVSSF